MSGTEAAFAGRTMRFLKIKFYWYMEEYGYKSIQKLSKFVTALNSRKNCSIELILENVKKSEFLPILYSKPLREYIKVQFKIGERLRISKYDLPFRKGYERQFAHEIFEIIAISSPKLPTFTVKKEQDEIIWDKFYQKALIKVI